MVNPGLIPKPQELPEALLGMIPKRRPSRYEMTLNEVNKEDFEWRLFPILILSDDPPIMSYV